MDGAIPRMPDLLEPLADRRNQDPCFGSVLIRASWVFPWTGVLLSSSFVMVSVNRRALAIDSSGLVQR